MNASRVFSSSLVVIAATAVVASAAQRPQTHFRSSQPPAAAAPVRAPNVVLWNQTTNPGANSIVSQDFESAYDAYDSMAAADFVVPPATTWSVTGAFFMGAYFNGTGPMPNLNLTFFNDAAGIPGTVACNYPLLGPANFSDAAGTLTVTLPAPCPLSTGTYWVMAQARLDFAVGGEWGWTIHTVNPPPTANGKWQNPGGGFPGGCTSWTDVLTCIPTAGGPDYSFQITGTVVPVELQDFSIE